MKRNILKKLGFIMSFIMLVACSENPNLSSLSNNSSIPLNTSGIKAQYTISFFEDGGSEVSDIIAESGTSIELPVTLKQNAVFAGWYYDYGTYNDKCNIYKMPSKNLVLYAKWDKYSSDEVKEYEKELASYSEPGHLYIHYKRFTHTEEDYAEWNLWVWAKNATGREFEWMETSEGIKYDDYAGAVCDIDLTKTYNDGGNDKKETISYLDENGELVEEIGFLIVYKASKNLNGHWQSDGGNQYFYTSDGLREDGSIHLFAIQDNVSDYVFSYSDEEVDNPYDNDDGTNVSAKYDNVDSSNTSKYSKAKTSTTFKENVGVGYQVMTASFADSDGDGMGDIKGITDNLDYLENTLHINALWLTPIQLSDSYHGYDIIDYTVVDPKFGSKETNYKDLLDEKGRPTQESAMADYKELVSEAHKRDIKIIMDLVINHTSTNNIWFKESSALNPDYRGFYQWKNHETDSSVATNKNWHKYSTYPYSYYGKFASSMPELNYDYQGTRDAIVDVAKFWLGLLGDGTGVDGFRIDAVKHIYMADEVNKSSNDTIINDYDTKTETDYSSNLTKNLNFFREFNSRVKDDYPNSIIIGENFDGHAYRVAPYYEGLDSMLNFYMYYNLAQSAAVPDGWSFASRISGATENGSFNASELGVTYGGKWNFPSTHDVNNKYRGDTAIESIFTSNHDVARALNCMVGTVSGTDLTPAQISTSNSSEAIKKAKVYASAILTLPGISWIYYGDELGMSGNYGNGETSTSPHADRWYRQPFKWGNDYNTQYTTNFTFSGDKTYSIEWDNYNKTLKGVENQKNDNNSMLSIYSELTELKSNDKVLIYGDYEVINAGNDVMAFKRTLNGKTYYIYHNFGSVTTNISGATGAVLYSLNGASRSSLPGYSSIIIG